MSRGPGTVQRAVMAALERAAIERPSGTLDTFELAAIAYGVAPDADGVRRLRAAQLSAVRRALGRLRAVGRVDGRPGRYGRTRWGTLPVIAAWDAHSRRGGR